ncbi:unnamed protein product, partial [Musa hybrid cultivar]
RHAFALRQELTATTSAGFNASRFSSATDLEAFEFGIDRLCHHCCS